MRHRTDTGKEIWLLIDMDRSVEFDSEVESAKGAEGYSVPPELAQCLWGASRQSRQSGLDTRLDARPSFDM